MSYFNAIRADDSASIDAFSRWRTSAPENIFESQFTYDLQPLVYEQVTATGGSVAHLPNESSAQLTVTTTNGSSAAMQTYRYLRYQPLKSQMIAMTFVMGAATANVRKRIGQFDVNDGLFLEQNGTTDLAVARRTFTSGSAVDNRVVQASWNLDKLDGTGKSGLTLDLTKGNIMIVDYQWLGYGRVRFGFDINGLVVYCHQFLNANSLATVYATTMNLPLRVEITNTNTSAGANMKYTCGAVVSEGGQVLTSGYDFAVQGTVTAGSGTQTHILSIQPKTTFNSIANRSLIVPREVNIVVTGSNPVFWELCVGTAISGTTAFNDVNATYSGMQYNTLGTLSGTPAITVQQGYVVSSNTVKSQTATDVVRKYPITLDASGAARTLGRLTLLVTGIGGTSACQASIGWTEVR